MYKCVFHPRTLLVTDKTIAFFVERGHWPRCSPALTQTKISKARYRGESHRTVSGLALYFRQYRIILSADTASEVRQMPSQKRR